MKYDYSKFEVDKNKVAQIIWNNPFFSGLDKLSKYQLKLIIECLISELDYIKLNNEIDERDIKDILFDKKCLVIECLNNKFFKKEINI